MRAAISIRARLSVAILATAASLAAVSTATAATAPTLSGSCQISGPIHPQPPITVIPVPGSHFSFLGTGTCSGMLDGAAITNAPATITFDNVSTLFDTCELGPDVNLPGVLTVGTDKFPFTLYLARAALAGPFLLTTSGNGLAVGVATFTPPNATTAIQDCAGAGIATATLAANFNTVTTLVGTVPQTPGGSRHHKRHHKKHRRG
jgi:hypothetical protein